MGAVETPLAPDESDHEPAGSLSPRTFRIGIAVVGTVATVVRLLHVAWTTSRRHLGGDEFYYYWQARDILDGHWFIQPYSILYGGTPSPGADHPPGFVLLSAFLGSIGIKSPTSQRYALALLGVVTVLVIAFTIRRVIGDRAALIAGLIAAVYPNLWVNDGLIMSETMFLLAFTVALYGVFRFRQEHDWKWLLVLAVALTVATSARPESILLFVLIVLPAVIGATPGQWRRRLAMLGVSALIPIVAFTPWVVFNSVRFHHPVIMSTGAGQTLLQGNCDETYNGASLGVNRYGCLGLVPVAKGTNVNLAELDSRYRHAAIDYMLQHKRRLPAVVLAREGRTWGIWRTRQQRQVDHYFENRGSLNVILWQQRSWWLLALLALPGLVIWRRQRFGLYPLVAQIALTVVVTSSTFGSTRYRAGAEVCVVMLATATIEFAWRWLRRRAS